jgi:acyltransferase
MHRFFIDQLKCFGIFCVVFGHNDYSIYGDYVYTFHMPLFFFLAGMMFQKSSDKISFGSYSLKKAKRLLIPYFILGFLLYFFWLILGRHYGNSLAAHYDPMQNFIGLFYAQGGPEYMNWGIPMWFLPALFLTNILYFPLSYLIVKYRLMVLLVLGIIGFYINLFIPFHLPWSLDIVPVLMVFFGVGDLIGYPIIDNLSRPKRIVLMLIALGIHTVGFIFNTKINIYDGIYGNTWLMLVTGIAGSVWLLIIFSFIPQNKLVQWVGKNSLPIMAFHLIAMTVIKGIALVFSFELPFTTIFTLLYSVIQICILIPVIYFFNTYFPFAVGIGSKKGLTSQ